ncbi:hypothetical protein ACVNPZ_16205 [Staphylococcus aureus]
MTAVHNIEAGGKSAYNNVSLAGPQHSEIGFLISTDIASWGPQQMKLDPRFLQHANWGNGPQTQKLAETHFL